MGAISMRKKVKGRRRDQPLWLSRTFLGYRAQRGMGADFLGKGLGFLAPRNSLLDLEEWLQVERLPQKCHSKPEVE